MPRRRPPAAQVAAELGVHKSTVTRAAKAHGIGQKHGRDWLFSKGDVAKIKRVTVGKPTPSSDEMRRRVMRRWER